MNNTGHRANLISVQRPPGTGYAMRGSVIGCWFVVFVVPYTNLADDSILVHNDYEEQIAQYCLN